MSKPLPESDALGLDPDAERVDRLAREILGDAYQLHQLQRVEAVEDIIENRVKVRAHLERFGTDESVDVEGEGVGVVDAFFDSLLRVFADEYPSLKTIEVADFEIRTKLENAHGRKSDAEAEAVLRIRNSEGVEFAFTARSPSVTRSTMEAALHALSFFINSERAYVQLHRALLDAKERRRADLVERYRGQMGTLVAATSYSEVIERLRASEE
jgi:hypothetical protein